MKPGGIRNRVTVRMVMALFYLGLLFGGAGLVYGRIMRFTGDLCLFPGKAESTVIRPSGSEGGIAPLQRNLPPAVIPFDNPREVQRLLGDEGLYDAAQLPFRLRLENIEVLEERPPVNRLEFTRPMRDLPGDAEKQVVDAVPGASVPVADGLPVAVRAIRPWIGLIPSPRGRPMAAVSLRRGAEGAWTRILLDTDAWKYAGPGIGLRLRWFEKEADARQALPGPEERLSAARWGVVEENRIHWFDAFTPGTGVELADSREVLLLKHTRKEKDAWIDVGIRTEEGPVRRRIHANAGTPDPLIRFEDPGLYPVQLLIHAWNSGEALALMLDEKDRRGPELLTAETVWQAGGNAPVDVRLDQALAAALPVQSSGDSVMECVFDFAGRRLDLREGEVTQHAGYRIRYRRVPAPPLTRYSLRPIPPGGNAGEAFTLGPGGRKRIGQWVFSWKDGNAWADRCAILAARRGSGPAQGAGAVLMLAGAAGMVILRFMRRPRFRDMDTVVLEDPEEAASGDAD
jgi:hypothetical protein